jgi:hypothetical protein
MLYECVHFWAIRLNESFLGILSKQTLCLRKCKSMPCQKTSVRRIFVWMISMLGQRLINCWISVGMQHESNYVGPTLDQPSITRRIQHTSNDMKAVLRQRCSNYPLSVGTEHELIIRTIKMIINFTRN